MDFWTRVLDLPSSISFPLLNNDTTTTTTTTTALDSNDKELVEEDVVSCVVEDDKASLNELVSKLQERNRILGDDCVFYKEKMELLNSYLSDMKQESKSLQCLLQIEKDRTLELSGKLTELERSKDEKTTDNHAEISMQLQDAIIRKMMLFTCVSIHMLIY